MQYLLKHKVLLNQKDNLGNTARDIARLTGQTELLELLENYDENDLNRNGYVH